MEYPKKRGVQKPEEAKLAWLNQILYQKPGDIDQDKFRELIEGFMDFEGHVIFPLGEYAPYVYDFSTDSMIRIGEGIERILGISPGEVISKRNSEFIGEFLSIEHAPSLLNFSKIFYDFICARKDEDLMVMLDVNMESRDKEKKRILIQFRPAIYDAQGKPAATWGLFTDITPIKREGPPQMICMENGRPVSIHKGNVIEMLNPYFLPLNSREIEVLSLRGKGHQIKEIAEKLHLQRSTVFSYLRDIRRKTNMDIIPLIRMLTEKGVIS